MSKPVINKEKMTEKNELLRENGKGLSESAKQTNQPDLKTDVGEVSDFMEGLDVPTDSGEVSEKISEDDKKQQGAKRGQAQATGKDEALSFGGIAPFVIPSQKIMVKQIRKELHREINELMKQAKREENKGAFYLTEILEKIRGLQGILYSLASATYEVIKNIYISLFDKKNKDLK